MRCRLTRTLTLLAPCASLSCPPAPSDTTGATETSTTSTTSATLTTATGTTVGPTSTTTGAPACPEDEFEPNDSIETATAVLDGEISAVICPDDIDTFALSITGETYLSIVGYLVRDDGQIAVELLAPNMSLIRRSSGSLPIQAYDPDQGVEAIHAHLDDTGTYYVQVSHVTGMDEIAYSLVLQRFVDDSP